MNADDNVIVGCSFLRSFQGQEKSVLTPKLLRCHEEQKHKGARISRGGQASVHMDQRARPTGTDLRLLSDHIPSSRASFLVTPHAR